VLVLVFQFVFFAIFGIAVVLVLATILVIEVMAF